MRVIKRNLVRKDPAGYEVWSETYQMGDVVAQEIRQNGDDSPQTEEVSGMIQAFEGAAGQTGSHEVAYNPDGAYIGNLKVAKMLCEERGIAPELIPPDMNVCSIGFCKKEQKWYGWSHRAIHGFSIGDVVKEGDCCALSGWTDDYLANHPEADLSLPIGFKAKTLDDAKRMAIAFAESVS